MLRHDPVARPTARMCREVVEMIVNGEHPKAGDIKSQQIPKEQWRCKSHKALRM